MADHIVERALWLPRPRAEVFAFFADPRHLPLVVPPWLRFRWRASPPAVVTAGTLLDFDTGVLGRWRVMVRELDAPYRIVDVQLLGPFARWEQRHRFREGARPGGGAGGTWVEDVLRYKLPGGALGRLAHGLGAGGVIARALAYRDRRLAVLLGAS
ncbi:MAG: CDP-paratose 2-epimerase [Candidatus Rokubacteria bacterium]|nr:CDP-paratose 2-epimerase [Candidatus Rokubacteria bacterium]